MNKIKQQLVFFGNEQLASGVHLKPQLLAALIKNGYSIQALILNQSPIISRRSKLSLSEELAKKNNIPVLKPNTSKELLEVLKTFQVDVGLLAAYGRIVPKEVIELFPGGIVNLHPSLLPQYRGSAPVEQAILDSKSKTGVSVMRLSEKMDAGPVYAQKSIKLAGDESKQQLADTLLEIGRDLLIDILPDILSGKLKPMSQNEQIATYSPRIKKTDGIIDWQKPASQIEREIKAYAGWPQSRTQLFGKEVIITKAHAIAATSKKPGTIEVIENAGILMVYAKSGYLCIERLKPAGKKEMSAAEFIRGYKRA